MIMAGRESVATTYTNRTWLTYRLVSSGAATSLPVSVRTKYGICYGPAPPSTPPNAA